MAAGHTGPVETRILEGRTAGGLACEGTVEGEALVQIHAGERAVVEFVLAAQAGAVSGG